MLSMEGIAKQAMMALMFSRGLVFRHTRLWCTWKTSETTAHHHHDMLAVCLRPCDPQKHTSYSNMPSWGATLLLVENHDS